MLISFHLSHAQNPPVSMTYQGLEETLCNSGAWVFNFLTSRSSSCLCCSVQSGPIGRTLFLFRRFCTLMLLPGMYIILYSWWTLISVMCLLECHTHRGPPYPFLSLPTPSLSFPSLCLKWQCYLFTVILLECDIHLPKSHHAMQNCATGFMWKLWLGAQY